MQDSPAVFYESVVRKVRYYPFRARVCGARFLQSLSVGEVTEQRHMSARIAQRLQARRAVTDNGIETEFFSAIKSYTSFAGRPVSKL